jgi:SAM-dependent methyltransferase
MMRTDRDEKRAPLKLNPNPAMTEGASPEAWWIELPAKTDGQLPQDAEWCHLHLGNQTRRLRFHDYDKIYTVPGLYEHLFYDQLKCCSPQVIGELLGRAVERFHQAFSSLRILDLGAGNGMVGESLLKAGAGSVSGVDIIPEAAAAAERDRPGVYQTYVVDDLTRPSTETRVRLEQEECNCLTSVSALGFGDIPPLAFCEAFNAITTPGWVAFNIKEDFLTRRDDTGFSGLIHRMTDHGILEILDRQRYQHRLAADGSPLYYVAAAGRKQQEVPETWMLEFRQETGLDTVAECVTPKPLAAAS